MLPVRRLCQEWEWAADRRLQGKSKRFMWSFIYHRLLRINSRSENHVSKRIYAYRVTRCHRNNSNSCRNSVPRVRPGEGVRTDDLMPLQHQANRPGGKNVL